MRSDYQRRARNRSPGGKLALPSRGSTERSCSDDTREAFAGFPKGIFQPLVNPSPLLPKPHLQVRPRSQFGRLEDVVAATITVLRTSTPMAVQKYQRV
jgi:hypothetical protein